MVQIALYPGSFKPFHSGHLHVIQTASQNNDFVGVYVSLTDRKKSGEATIFGKDMAEIWKNHLMAIMPKNVNISFFQKESPIRQIYKELGEAEESLTNEHYKIYGDPNDLQKNFKEESLNKHFPNLTSAQRLELCPISRSEGINISGTEMRKYLDEGDKGRFLNGLPDQVDKEAIWDLLKKSMESQFLSQVSFF